MGQQATVAVGGETGRTRMGTLAAAHASRSSASLASSALLARSSTDHRS
ncbi:hypothetical protein ACFQX7_31265 [Luedemannella flava]